jgi:hypothetical protein
MNALFLTLFVSLVILLGMVLFFAFLFSHHNHEQSDRLALLPLQEDATASPGAVAESDTALLQVGNSS